MVSRLGPLSRKLCCVLQQDTPSTQHPIQEKGGGGGRRVNYSRSFHSTETRICSDLTGHLAVCRLNLFLPARGSVRSQ